MAKRRRWEEELEREAARAGKPELAQLDKGKRAGVLEELQRSGGNRALQQVVGGPQLQRDEAAPKPSPSTKEWRTFMLVDDIPGPVADKAHAGQFEVRKFSHKVTSPRDVSSGRATGKRQHSPVTVTLPTSEGTVPFRQAGIENKTIKKITIFRPSQTITLTNVTVSLMEDLDEDQVLLSFVYEGIEWNTPGSRGGEVYSDKWAEPERL
jgi:type VI secretion system Hcp family effector